MANGIRNLNQSDISASTAERFLSPVNTINSANSSKTIPTSKQEKLTLQNQLPDEVSVSESVTATEGYATHPTESNKNQDDERGADFYRYGQARVQTETGFDDLASGDINPTSLQPSGVGFGVMPRRIEEYEDQEASIRIIGPKKGSKEEVDLIPAYTKFFLQSTQESNQERSQIVETFGDFYVFLFGQRPQITTFSGTLLNSKNASWYSDFKFMYQNFLRGTKCVENNSRLILTFGGTQVEGLMLNASFGRNSDMDHGVQFSFQLLILDEKFTNFSNDFGLVVSDGKLAQSRSFLELLTSSGLADNTIQPILEHTRKALEKVNNPAKTDKVTNNQQGAVEEEFGTRLTRTLNGGLRLPGIN